MTPQLARYFERWTAKVNKALDHYLPKENVAPQSVHKAMRYSIFAGGKRLRPVLVIAGSEICGLSGSKVLPTACALEMIHTYSLIHDDLPAMDDDDLRRGKPTSHKVFGEAIAILTGDALLTYAFHLIAKNSKMVNSAGLIPQVVETVAQGAGFAGMVGGQVVDIEMGEGKWFRHPRKKQIEILNAIHRGKTAALIKSSLLAGAYLASARPREVKRLERYAEGIGLAFQIADDILDITGDKKLLGKKGSDQANRKLTYPAIYGLEESKRKARSLVAHAKAELNSFGSKSQVLSELADYIIARSN